MNTGTSTSSGIGSTINEVTSTYKNATKEFLESNSLVAKVAFLLLVLFVFTILLRLGIWFLGYYLTDSRSPKLLDGMIDAKVMRIIPQDPKLANAVNVSRSTNEREGIEFTWSCWIYINDINTNPNSYKCVFYKGNDFVGASGVGNTGLNFPNNAPGLYIAPNTNNLVVVMNTFNDINTKVTINDIPIRKWFNVIIRCQNTLLDVYINGGIAKSLRLQGVPKQNYGDVYIAPNGGFDGYISNLWYYNSALTPTAINAMISNGPNTNMVGADGDAMNLKNPDYLSLRWYFSGIGDGYNPSTPTTPAPV
jgi:hypothetical protein